MVYQGVHQGAEAEFFSGQWLDFGDRAAESHALQLGVFAFSPRQVVAAFRAGPRLF